jgi:hypothetical protein
MKKLHISSCQTPDHLLHNVKQGMGSQGFFQGFFRAVKRTQKLNLELSFETQSSHQSFSAVKIKLFELNFVTCGN